MVERTGAGSREAVTRCNGEGRGAKSGVDCFSLCSVSQAASLHRKAPGLFALQLLVAHYGGFAPAPAALAQTGRRSSDGGPSIITPICKLRHVAGGIAIDGSLCGWTSNNDRRYRLNWPWTWRRSANVQQE